MNRVVSCCAILCGLLLCGCVNSGDSLSAGIRAQEFIPSRIVIEKAGGVIESIEAIHVPANEEWIFSEAVEFRVYGAITVDGVIRGLAPDTNRADGPSMTLSSVTGIVIRGEVHGFPGADGDYPGANGGDGGTLIIRTPVLTLNQPLIAPRGGGGVPKDQRYANRLLPDDNGRGGTGGRLEVYAQIIGPYDDAGDYVTGLGNAIGGPGGRGGGNGGSAISGLFREAPWMVKYREYYLLTDEEIAEAKGRGEIR
ncbi:MAG: hypothetical protein ACFHWZ_13080 [Phycisphaerales bacterium]|nr:hypothetical protein [bacterium]